MAAYTRVNLKSDVKDMAPEFGMEGIESRFARTNLELENSGLSYFRLDPGYRAPFGHTHSEQEEVYVILSGSARVAVGDEVVELGEWDASGSRRRRCTAWRRGQTAPRSLRSALRTRTTRTPTCSRAGGPSAASASDSPRRLEVRVGHDPRDLPVDDRVDDDGLELHLQAARDAAAAHPGVGQHVLALRHQLERVVADVLEHAGEAREVAARALVAS